MSDKTTFIKLKSGTLEKVNEGYILIKYTDYPIIDLKEVKLRDQAILDLCNEQLTPLLIDTRGSLIEYSTEAREYMAKSAEITNYRKAEAFVISNNNVGLKMLVNNYIKLNKEKCPVKIFNNIEDALIWVRTFL